MTRHHALVMLLALTLAGCGGGEKGDDTGKKDGPKGDGHSAHEPVATPPRPDKVEIKVVDHAQYEAEIAKLKGRVVLVDGWAMWCTECLKEFPHTLAFADTYGDLGLTVVTLSFDDEEQHDAAMSFLEKKNALVTNLRVKTGSSEESFEQWGIASGTLPHVKIYGRDGKVARTFDAGDDPDAPSFTHEDVESGIKEVLAAE